MMIHLVPGGTHGIYAEKGNKQGPLHGLDKKCGFTSVLGFTVEGLVL